MLCCDKREDRVTRWEGGFHFFRGRAEMLCGDWRALSSHLYCMGLTYMSYRVMVRTMLFLLLPVCVFSVFLSVRSVLLMALGPAVRESACLRLGFGERAVSSVRRDLPLRDTASWDVFRSAHTGLQWNYMSRHTYIPDCPA